MTNSMGLSCGNEANPRIGNAAKVTALFAVALLALPAFAGTATYLGSHTAGDVRLTDFPALTGNQIVTYTDDTIIFTGEGGGSARLFFPTKRAIRFLLVTVPIPTNSNSQWSSKVPCFRITTSIPLLGSS